MDEIERMNIVALRADVAFGRPLLTELLTKLNTNGRLMLGIIEDVDPMQIPLEQIMEMEIALQELVDFDNLPENNFEWDEKEESFACGFCGSHDNRVGGIKSHIRNNHIEK